MSRETLELIQRMDLENIETQLALQCAPLITGLKISNLLIVRNKMVRKVDRLLKNTDISYIVLLAREQKTTLLLYREEGLKHCLIQKDVKDLLRQFGYEESELIKLFSLLQKRYAAHMENGALFPHELGLILGYPAEDAEGFISNNGKNFLYSGYWKVYHNVPDKIKLFCQYELAKETLIQLISKGISTNKIIKNYSNNKLRQAVG